MKSNIVKYIFFAIVGILIIYAVYSIYNEDKNSNINNVQETKTSDINIITDIRIPIVNLDTMNPILSKNRNVQDISRLIYEPLMSLDENYKPQACIAKEWSVVDNTSYLIKIRDNIAIGLQIKPTTASANFANYSLSERLQNSFDAFTEKFKGKVFIIFSSKVDNKKVIANKEVIEEIREEIQRLEKIYR